MCVYIYIYACRGERTLGAWTDTPEVSKPRASHRNDGLWTHNNDDNDDNDNNHDNDNDNSKDSIYIYIYYREREREK